MFIDEATITVNAGDGGDGKISFKRGYGQRHGGPDGGNGGRGGDIYLQADRSVNTLMKFENKNTFVADSGQGGGSQNRTGKSAKDTYIDVPVGTIVYDGSTEEQLIDLNEEGKSYRVVEGGSGGRGNAAFASPSYPAPQLREVGEKGDERYLGLELKMLADVGIVGFPNVGKSSLIARISAQKPKIGNYHFTTMDPHPGVVEVGNWDSFVAVDIPGLIEGAHQGRGLGDKFLKHLGRTKTLVHMVDISGIEGRDPLEDWRTLRREIRKYDSSLGQITEIIAGNKMDLIDDEEVSKQVSRFSEEGLKMHPVSAATGEGIDELVNKTYEQVQKVRETSDRGVGEEESDDKDSYRVYRFEGEKGFRVLQEGDVFIVEGKEVEKLVEKLDFSTVDAPDYFHRKLEDKGVIKKLKSNGATDGSIIKIGGQEFELVT
ncbi:GTPase ObgE [Candidatus Bipolaricaulota bacterium]|nr:GTPase ObgE [Candidatus Bipolaricaulota bacterium]